ncbi:MAG: hypothetical protein P8L44_10970 [Opitutales bacterium]|nr:hypothetical protein [Opitutales bacterium]
MHFVTGGYLTSPRLGSWPLVMAQPLLSMKADSDPYPALFAVPAVSTRVRDVGVKGRVLTSTHGASPDLLDENLRRLLINACFWAVHEESRITSDLNIDFVGPFKPREYASWGWQKGVKPRTLKDTNPPSVVEKNRLPPKAI